MTLCDLALLVRHFWKQAVAVVVLCAVLGAAVAFVKSGPGAGQFSAEAVLTISDPTDTISSAELLPIAQAIATNIISQIEDDEVSIEQRKDAAQHSLTFTVEADTEKNSIDIANDIARRTADETTMLLRETADRYREESRSDAVDEVETAVSSLGILETNKAAALETVAFTVNDAREGVERSGMRYVLIGVLLGLFLSVCMMIVFDSIKRPVKNGESLNRATSLPVLAAGSPSRISDKIWANIQFEVGGVPQSVCLLPAGKASVPAVFDGLKKAVLGDIGSADPVHNNIDNVEICISEALSESIAGAFDARGSDITVVIVSRWNDSVDCVIDTINELKLARVDRIGLVLIDSE